MLCIPGQVAQAAERNGGLGPFFRGDPPQRPNGADLSESLPGMPLYVEGLVVDHQRPPVAGAEVDVRHADADGRTGVDGPGLIATAMRTLVRADEAGETLEPTGRAVS